MKGEIGKSNVFLKFLKIILSKISHFRLDNFEVLQMNFLYEILNYM